MSKVYAVKVGMTPGLYYSWEECKAVVNGYPGAKYKSFATEEEANAWLNGQTITKPTVSHEIDEFADGATVCIYADGASKGNPGPGGYGCVVKTLLPDGTITREELSGGFDLTTNNRMELMGILSGIVSLNKPSVVNVFSDSSCTITALNNGRLDKISKNPYIADSFPNKDLWLSLAASAKKHELRYHWIKGHDGYAENERCDKLAVAAAQKTNKRQDDGYIALTEKDIDCEK